VVQNVNFIVQWGFIFYLFDHGSSFHWKFDLTEIPSIEVQAIIFTVPAYHNIDCRVEVYWLT